MVLLRQKRRLVGLAAAAAVGAATLALGSPRAWADDTPASRETTPQGAIVESVELSEAPLGLAINLIRQKTGVNVAIQNSGEKFGKVTISIRRRPIGEVLKLMAESAGADFWEENGVYWFGPKGAAPKKELVKVETDVTPLTPVAAREDDIQYEKIILKYSDPHMILRRLGLDGGSRGDINDIFAANVLRMMLEEQTPYRNLNLGSNLLLQNGSGPGGYQNINPSAVPAAPVGTQANQGTTNNLLPNVSGANDQNARRDSDTFADFGRGGGQFGGQPPRPPAGGGAGGNGAGGSAQGLLPDGINAGDFSALDADGSLIFRQRRGNEIPFRHLKELIQLLDVKPRQIMIKAEFVTVTQNDQSSFGINWNFQKVNLIAGVTTGFTTPNTAFIQYAAGNLQTQLSWILTTGRGKIVAAPMATTLNNVPVQFLNTQQVPVFISTPIISQNGTVALSTNAQFIGVSTGLNVLPRINADDTITLFGSVLVSDLGTTVTGPNGESLPNILTQTAPIQRIIRNGDTLVVGGLTSKNNTVNTNRVPLLGDLPIVGTLFRSRNVQTRDSDLLVFITASIIPERPTINSLPGGGVGGGGVPGIGGPGGAGGGITP